MPTAVKRARRTAIVAWVAVGIVVVASGAYFLRQAQLDRAATEGRDAGRAALAAGDPKAALDGLGDYLQRFGGRGATAQDYVLYARARRQVEIPNGKHVVGAIWSLRKALVLEPKNEEARKDLLALYIQAGYATETLELADAMLADDPNDLHLLRVKCDLLEQMRRFDRGLEAARELNRRAPDSLVDLFRTLRLMSASQQITPAEIDAWVDEVVKAHPDDPRVELLRASTFTRRHEEAKAKETLDRVLAAATNAKSIDVDFTVLLATELDAAGRFGDSLRVLVAAQDSGEPELRREIARRLWYAGRAAEIPPLVARWNADAADEPELAALAAASLRAAGRDAEAEPTRRALAARIDSEGRAWSTFVESVGPRPATDLPGLAAAVKAVPDSAVLRQALGDADAALGETYLALEAWNAAAKRAPAWSIPLTRIARTLLLTGREQLALSVARAAVVRSPDDPEAVTTYVRAAAAAVGDVDRRQLAALLSVMDTIDREAPEGEAETFALRIDLLARADKSAAEEKLRAALASSAQRSESTLLRLARIAERAGIALSSDFLAASEAAHGVTPQLALAKALAARGRGADAALAVFDETRKSAGAAAQAAAAEWAAARASCLDGLRRPEAGAAWIALADAQPGSVQTQLGALSSTAVWKDRDAVARVIERLHGLTGDDAVTWRVARARWLLGAAAPSSTDLVDASRMLGDVTRVAPDCLSARLLLAKSLEMLGNLPGAEEQLRSAAVLVPDDAGVSLEIARLAQLQGNNETCRRQLERVLTAKDVAPEQIERAAYLLSRQGDYRRGAEVLEPYATQATSRRDGVMLLARMCAKMGETDRAISLVGRLLANPDADVIEMAAGLHASAGDAARADALLASLDGLVLSPGERELVRARHAARWKSTPEAFAAFRRAVDAAPGRADVWTDYLRQAIAVGDEAEANSILDDPRAAVAEPVRFVGSVRAASLSALRDPRRRTLLLAAVADKNDRAVLVEAIRVAGGDARSPEVVAQTARTLRASADANARVLPLQLVAASMCADAGDLAGACDVSRRAAQAFPTSAAAARQAAEIAARAGRWDDALDAAQRWRERDGGADPSAVSFMAEALLRTGRALEARRTLEPLADSAAGRDPRVRLLLGLAMLRSGAAPLGAEWIADCVRSAETCRNLALGVDADLFADPATASAWLSACETAIGPNDAPGRLRLARSWVAACGKFPSPELCTGAKRVLAALTSRPDATAQAWFTSALCSQQEGDYAAAAAGYQKALQLEPALVAARNNLAMVFADSGEWRRGVEEATAATRAAPRSADSFDTLAYALRKGGEFGKAKECLEEAIRLEPADPSFRVSLAETFAESGDFDAMAKVVSRVEEMKAGPATFPPSIDARLSRLRRKPE